MEKVIILDDKMRRVADLDPDLVIDPVTIEDIDTGEHTLSLGYPVSEPGANVRRLTTAPWTGCALDGAEIVDGKVQLESDKTAGTITLPPLNAMHNAAKGYREWEKSENPPLYADGREWVEFIEGYASGEGGVSKETDHLLLQANGFAGYRSWVASEVLNFDNIDEIFVELEQSTTVLGLVYFQTIDALPGEGHNAYTASIYAVDNLGRTTLKLDTSGISGNHYIRVLVRSSFEDSAIETKVYRIGLGDGTNTTWVDVEQSLDGGPWTRQDAPGEMAGVKYDTAPEIRTRARLYSTAAGATPTLESIDEIVYSTSDAAHLEGGNTVIIPDPDGDLIPFAIREADLHARGEVVRTARCEHLYYELADGPIRSYALTNQTPATAITAALVGTRWQTGSIDAALAALVKDFQAIHLNPLEFLRLIEKEFQARLKFRVTVGGAGITGYLVDLQEIEDTFSGKRFEFGHDLESIDIRVDRSNVKTALVGTALGEEVDPITGDPLPLTFKAAEWSKAAGDPADKPKGQDWVGNEDARKLYGIYDPATGGRLHRFGRYESQAESPETLLQATWLIGTRYHFAPRVTVEGTVADLERARIVDIKTGNLVPLDHEKIRLGQITYVIARHKGLLAAVDVKITRIERHLKRPDRTRITWGDPIPLGSDYMREIKRAAEWRDKRRRKLDRGRGGQTIVIASEDTSYSPYYASKIVKSGEDAATTTREAIQEMPATGGRVLFMDGIYDFSLPIEIPDNISVEGQGDGTIWRLCDNYAHDYLVTNADRVNGNTKIKIKSVALDGNKENQASIIDGISTAEVNNAVFDDITVHDFSGNGIKTTAPADTGHTNTWHKIRAHNNGENGMFLEQIRDSTVQACHANDNGDAGIAVGGIDMSIIGNYALRNGGAGIFSIGQGCLYEGNICNENALDGILLSFSGDSNIIGNTAKNNDRSGIRLQMASSENNVQTNKCAGNEAYGIHVNDALCIGNIVTNNSLTGNAIDGLKDDGTATATDPGNYG